MEIRSIGGINPADNNKPPKHNKTSPSVNSIPQKDSLNISEDARFIEDEAFIKDVLSKIPDIDYNKVNNIKNKLDNGEYNNKEVLDVLTEKLAKVLGL